MIKALILLMALQATRAGSSNSSPTTDPKALVGFNALGAAEHLKDGLRLSGKLIFPSDVRPVIVDIELEDVLGRVVRTTKSGANNEFKMEGIGVEDGVSRYFIVVQPTDGFDYVRQQITLSIDNFIGAFVTIQLRHRPGSLASDLEDVISLDVLNRVPPKDAQKLYDKAREEQTKGETLKAVADFEKAAKMAPDFYDAHLQLGLEYQKASRIDEAIRVLTHALEINPASMKARAALGQMYCDTGNFKESARLLSEAVRLGGTSSSIYYALGVSYQKMDELDLAEESLQRSIVIAGGTIREAYFVLHNIYLKRKQLDKALFQLDAYLKKFPDAPDREEVQTRADKIRKAVGPQ